MKKMVMIADIVEENGKTIRQNNNEKTHKIPVGSLVELIMFEDEYYGDYNGVRLFVKKHTRDCDGTPLYTLGFDQYETYGYGEESLLKIK